MEQRMSIVSASGTTEQIDWDKFKCRCSKITAMLAASRSNPCLTESQSQEIIALEGKEATTGKPLTDKQKEKLAELYVKKENSTKVILSDGCIDYLMEAYAWETEGMIPVDKEVLNAWQLNKGKEVEEDSITLLSLVNKEFYVKNDQRVYNDYLSGEPDIYVGEDIYSASKITDIKSKWDYPGFLKSIHKAVENGYNDQVAGYCDITGAKIGEIARCLVSMTPEMREEWRRRLSYKGGYVTEESPEFLEKWQTIEHSMVFDKIPINKRVFKLDVQPFSQERRQMVYDRVKICREWLWKFDEQYQKLNQ